MADQKYTEEQFSNFVNNLFTTHDSNSDNKLDHDECKAALTEAHGKFGAGNAFNDENFEKKFIEMDTNKDGTVDKAELYAFLHAIAAQKGMIC